MTSRVPGIAGSLFPSQYLADGLARDARALPAGTNPAGNDAIRAEQARRRLEAWWRRVAATCGPATGLRALFDVVAMPLCASLGFRARDATFDRGQVRVQLATPNGTAVALVIRPWSARPSALWREVVSVASDVGASWGFVFAPPYLSLVDARGHALRRSLDFTLPDVLDPGGFGVFWTLARAGAFEKTSEVFFPDSEKKDLRGRVAVIDTLVAAAATFEDRVRTDLQDGVIGAMGVLAGAIAGAGARSGARSGADGRFQEALTIVYRILFLLFAEARDLVPHHHPVYRDAYAIGALCRDAVAAEPARGLWEALAAITRLSRTGCRADDLIVRPFNGRLFARSAAPTLEQRSPSRRPTREGSSRDAALQFTLAALSTRPGKAGRETISYADLGVEQLGAVYERVLDLEPPAPGRPAPNPRVRRHAAGTGRRHSARRKETGTFYTPQPLCDFIVRRTLAPLVSGASSDAILSLRVVDPAMGSGAFLVAACRYLAAAYEQALLDEGRASTSDLDDHARSDIRRLVAERCLAGVDVNPVAVQLARLSLWLATLADGKPLGFLDHRLRVGNSLVGASPDDLRRVPERRRSPVRDFTLPLFDESRLEHTVRQIARPLGELLRRRDETIEDVHAKEAAWAALGGERSPLCPWRLASSLWCARWFWDAGAAPAAAEVRAAIAGVLRSDPTLRAPHLSRLISTTAGMESAHQFFHWPLEFADVFYDEHGQARDRPGFDAVIGNPPWEMLRRDSSTTEPRNRGTLEPRNPLVSFIRESGLYPSCDRGHVNLYQPFLERALGLTRTGGRVGLILPWGLAVDEGAAALRSTLLDRTSIDAIVGLDNGDALFPIHRGLRFLAVVTTPGGPTREIRARFGVRSAAELTALPDRDATATDAAPWPIRLTPHQIRRFGGSAARIPDVRRAADLDLLERLTGDHPPLGDSRGWGARFGRELNATDDREHFGATGLPVIEGKHLQPFEVDIRPVRRRIERTRAARLLPDGRHDHERLAYRDVSGAGNRLTLIAAIVPGGVVTTHTLFCLRTPLPIEQQHFLCALFNSYVLNSVARMLMGGHLTTGLVEGLPVPVWRGSAAERRIARLGRRLANGAGNRLMRARLQAAIARLFGLDHETFARVLEGFPLVPADERRLALSTFAPRAAFGLH